MIYNKLVRDKIPFIIEAEGKVVKSKRLKGDALKEALVLKLFEETKELADVLRANPNARESVVEEMADVMEVLYSICSMYDDEVTWDEVKKRTESKYAEKGGYDIGVFLEEVIDNG